MLQQSRSLRVLYAAGPGNVLGTYHHWQQGQEDPSQISVTYSGQFYNVCRSLDAQGYIISSFPEKTIVRDGQFTIEHRPKLLKNASGIAYHFNQILYGLQIAVTALRWKADAVVVADGTTHWFVLSLLTYLGIAVVPSIHCVLWCKYLPHKRIDRLVTALNRSLFSRSAAVLTASHDISAQVRQVVGKKPHPSMLEFLPLYRREEFDGLPPAHLDRLPFKVLFIGRVEPEKGVFDLLEVAKRLRARGRTDIEFGFCGTGSALEAMRQEIQNAQLSDVVKLYGYCHKPQLREYLGQAHVVIAPTQTTFIEGFCQVVAEGILSGRPVITSTVCPALSYVRSGVVEVPPDDVQGYEAAILRLCDDSSFYQEKQQGCQAVQEQFYDLSKSWGSMLKQALVAVQQQLGSVSHPTAAEYMQPANPLFGK